MPRATNNGGPREEGAGASVPTHYCVICAARWTNHPGGSWSLASNDCGPCCDNVSMDLAPIVKLQPGGTVDSRDYERARRAYDNARRLSEVDRYRGILCALCDEPFERHYGDWSCPHRVAPRFKCRLRAHSECAGLITDSMREDMRLAADRLEQCAIPHDGPSMSGMTPASDMVERVARAIEGPHKALPTDSQHTLTQLRDLNWSSLTASEKQARLNEAAAALEASHHAELVEALEGIRDMELPDTEANPWASLATRHQMLAQYALSNLGGAS